MSTKKHLPETVMIDGKHYDLAALSDNAQSQLANLRFADGQIRLLTNRKALVETARMAYGKTLADNLPEKKAAANRKKDVVNIGGERYWLDDLSETGRAQLYNIRFTDEELERLNNEQAVAQAARNRYAEVLEQELKTAKPFKTQ